MLYMKDSFVHRLCIFIFMSLLLAWEHYAILCAMVRQSCWIINKHSYTHFNSHENKCFYDDYLGYVRRVS